MEKIKLCYAPLSQKPVIARFGKDPTVALDKREVSSEFWQVLVQLAFGGNMPKVGELAEISFGGGDEHFSVTVTRK